MSGQVWTNESNSSSLVQLLRCSLVSADVANRDDTNDATALCGLENGSAGDVVSALEQRGTAYEVRGGSIYVPAEQRDELRMTLASEGLPANGGRGYELLDSLSGFGTTAQMFDAAYWRAKEGELARTIVSAPISARRVSTLPTAPEIRFSAVSNDGLCVCQSHRRASDPATSKRHKIPRGLCCIRASRGKRGGH